MYATLTFNLNDAQERSLYEKCVKLTNANQPYTDDKFSRYWGALSDKPRRLIIAAKAFQQDQTWTLKEWAIAAEMDIMEVKALLGPLSRVKNSQGWGPFEKVPAVDVSSGSYVYKFVDKARIGLDCINMTET